MKSTIQIHPIQLPEGYLRLPTVLKFIPVSRSTWWVWVKSGKAPKPQKLGPKITVWRSTDIRQFLEELDTDKSAA